MDDTMLRRQLSEWRGFMDELSRLDNPLGALDGRRYELLQRADHFAIEIAVDVAA